MRRFAALVEALDTSHAAGDKLAALQAWLSATPAADAAWGIWLLGGARLRRTVERVTLRELACQAAGIDDWLFEASYRSVGDLAETIALVMPSRPSPDAGAVGIGWFMENHLLPLRDLAADEQKRRLQEILESLDTPSRHLAIKLLCGDLRVGVSRQLIQAALAAHAGLDARVLAQRMTGWSDASRLPTTGSYWRLLDPVADPSRDSATPYPFLLAPILEQPVAQLGDPQAWLAEWMYDGIRAQLVCRPQSKCLWTRGGELVGERFPDVLADAQDLPNYCVLEGELLAWRAADPQPLPLARLLRRQARKTLTAKLLEETPVRFLAFDLLEWGGIDLRMLPQHERRRQLEALLAGRRIQPAPLLEASSWTQREDLHRQARRRGMAGLMLKHREAAYGAGGLQRNAGWWKWRNEPLTALVVLVYVQPGHGRSAGLHMDCSFAVWNRAPRDPAEADATVHAMAAGESPRPEGLQLVSVAKAHLGSSDAEFAEVERIVRQETLGRFGPVRVLKPRWVFELAFDAAHPSTRHKCGFTLRSPRISRLRPDKLMHEADTVQELRRLMKDQTPGGVEQPVFLPGQVG